ncbi:Uncharacterised protein [Mycobacteroides abscessus subsp. abscessus]|nr:Uncharacterised protein [Mycobacteroides abscessus subsp. abscessus]
MKSTVPTKPASGSESCQQATAMPISAKATNATASRRDGHGPTTQRSAHPNEPTAHSPTMTRPIMLRGPVSLN